MYHCGQESLDLDCGEAHVWIQIIQAHYGRVSYHGEKTCGISNYQNFWEDKVSSIEIDDIKKLTLLLWSRFLPWILYVISQLIPYKCASEKPIITLVYVVIST